MDHFGAVRIIVVQHLCASLARTNYLINPQCALTFSFFKPQTGYYVQNFNPCPRRISNPLNPKFWLHQRNKRAVACMLLAGEVASPCSFLLFHFCW